ncbi:hypothetical protein DKX38_023018 [Salix brachista]|uniref:Uncharacterized protein n=1 Tax=Salix brachista TaxID=2182728 RepID=A0A5N5K108_9ROSI|nr:hypothetical protein DKX38_023018 [Salix brachista]
MDQQMQQKEPREALAVLTELERDRLVSEEMTEEIPDEEEKAYAQMQWNQADSSQSHTCKMWNVETARVVFDTVVERDANYISWNSKLSEYTQNGQASEALKFHDLIMDNRTEIDTNLSNALVDRDAKCGDLDKAVDLFNGIHPSERNASSWNVLISGCGMLR